jgi:Condensin complex subunit 2
VVLPYAARSSPSPAGPDVLKKIAHGEQRSFRNVETSSHEWYYQYNGGGGTNTTGNLPRTLPYRNRTMDVLTERTNQLALDDDYIIHEENDLEESEGQARVSLNKRLSTNGMSRRRRRSSARFLKLQDDDPVDVPSNQDLRQVYQNAIRMNAENKITATNSWTLNLIDHMDRFLGRPSIANSTSVPLEDTLGPITGVNFTKASCTLDASVKIYSYRVDDVHLTSYKVLANLNRTDQGKKDQSKSSKDSQVVTPAARNTDEGAQDDGPARGQRRGARTNTETLETNLGTWQYYGN